MLTPPMQSKMSSGALPGVSAAAICGRISGEHVVYDGVVHAIDTRLVVHGAGSSP